MKKNHHGFELTICFRYEKDTVGAEVVRTVWRVNRGASSIEYPTFDVLPDYVRPRLSERHP